MRYPDIMNVPGMRTPEGLPPEQIATLAGMTIGITRHKITTLLNEEKVERVPDSNPARYRVRISGRNLITMRWRSNYDLPA